MFLVRSSPSPSNPSKAWPLGKAKLACYHGLDNAGSVDVAQSTLTMDRLLKRTVPWGLGFLGQGSWGGMDTVQRSFGGYVGLRENIIASIPLNQPGSTLAQVAAGNFDSYYTTVATKIRDLPFPNAVIRIGWEFNGDWYEWKARDVEADYVAAFQRVVGLFRAIPNQSFKYLWNPDKRCARYALATYADPPDCYPGDSYVDYVGIDAYNTWVNGVNAPTKNPDGTGGQPAAGEVPYPGPTQSQRWMNELVGTTSATIPGGTTLKPYCLAWIKAFADQHGKQIIIPEWGTGRHGTSSTANVGDDAYYIQQMAQWLIDNGVIAHGYWDRITGQYYTHITQYDAATVANFNNPNVRDAFAAAFGG